MGSHGGCVSREGTWSELSINPPCLCLPWATGAGRAWNAGSGRLVRGYDRVWEEDTEAWIRMRLQRQVGRLWTCFEANGWALLRVKMKMEVVTYDPEISSLSHMPGTEPPARGNVRSRRSGDPSRDRVVVLCHHTLTGCAHKPSPHVCQGHFCTVIKEVLLGPHCGHTLHCLLAPHYTHCAGVPSSHFLHTQLASVSSSAEQSRAADTPERLWPWQRPSVKGQRSH